MVKTIQQPQIQESKKHDFDALYNDLCTKFGKDRVLLDSGCVCEAVIQRSDFGFKLKIAYDKIKMLEKNDSGNFIHAFDTFKSSYKSDDLKLISEVLSQIQKE